MMSDQRLPALVSGPTRLTDHVRKKELIFRNAFEAEPRQCSS